MPHVHHHTEAGAAATVLLTVFSFLLNINLAQADAWVQFVTHVIQGGAATAACIVGFLTIKKLIDEKSKS